LDCGISVIITFELMGRVVIGVSTTVCVPVAAGVGAGGTGVSSLSEEHPAPRTNRIQIIPERIPIKIFWCMMKK
jgi:hypothetical protein